MGNAASIGGIEALLAVTLLLLIVALVAIANVMRARREARATLRLSRSHAEGLQDLLSTIRMAERIAGIGVWQYDPATGSQQWSDGLKRLFGFEECDDFVEGDAETLLCANNIDLVRQVEERGCETAPFALKFELVGLDEVERMISVHACNLMDGSGTTQRVVAVVRDVTDQVERERELETSRASAMNEAHAARLLAQSDPLTGLANRRRVMDALDTMVMDARVTQMPLVLVMFDVDHFKLVNDTFGHPAGDKVLKRIAHIANSQARGRDIVGRVGGEEFVWIISGASDGMARAMSNTLREAIAKEAALAGMPPVTVSLGYACITAGDTALSLLARADCALYQAKHSGRNTVSMAA